MKTRGFTLIELLAVIVVLTIIALITTPLVLNNITEYRSSGSKTSADSYIKAMSNTIVDIMRDDVDNAPGLYTVTDDGNVSKNGDKYSISIKGSKPKAGKICVSSAGDISKAYLDFSGTIFFYNGQIIELTDLTQIPILDCTV